MSALVGWPAYPRHSIMQIKVRICKLPSFRRREIDHATAGDALLDCILRG
ncbi:MAG: hypothetical protein ABJF09_12435 [Qipengyuania citrea]